MPGTKPITMAKNGDLGGFKGAPPPQYFDPRGQSTAQSHAWS